MEAGLSEEADRLYVVVSHRDRPEHLSQFLVRVGEYLERAQIDFAIWVVEQQPGDGPFNKGMLYNIPARYFSEQAGTGSWICFQDVDTVPVQGVHYGAPCPGSIHHLYGHRSCLGGAFTMRVDDYLKVNGFSNLYRGWGYEDRDFLRRALRCGMRVDRSHFTERYDASCFVELDADPDRPARMLALDRTRFNAGIFQRNVDHTRDGFGQLKQWRPFVHWISRTRRHLHCRVEVGRITEANREEILACVAGASARSDGPPERLTPV